MAFFIAFGLTSLHAFAVWLAMNLPSPFNTYAMLSTIGLAFLMVVHGTFMSMEKNKDKK